jgi:arsenate reductase (thioredoxin)
MARWPDNGMSQPIERPLKILFVCIGNSCRSQMAEAWASHFGKGKVQAFSAGSHPLGAITAETYEVMHEKGITLERQRSKGLREVSVEEMDVVVSMGCEVACPVPAGFQGRVVEWNIPDPYAQGRDYFRDVRDMVEQQVLALLADLITPHASRE